MEKVLFEVEAIELPTGKSAVTGNIHKVPFKIGDKFSVTGIDKHKGNEYYDLLDVESDTFLQAWNAKYFKKV